jgi:SAM-dependent methyltransferase
MSHESAAPEQSRTKATYGLQWNRFRILRPDEDYATFFNRTGLKPEDLDGKLVFDAGCGMGRYLRVAGGAGARLVGMDLSEATRAARDLTADLSDILILRGDLLDPPIAQGSFDLIYSIGVLDHTPDARKAFLSVARLLKPGGRIAIWIYKKERPLLEAIINVHRAISRRLPLWILLPLCRITAPIGGIKRKLLHSKNKLISKLGVALNVLTIGVSMHPDPEVRVCDTLDWYAPQYMSRHTLEEVQGWFREAGLVEVTDLAAQQVFFHQGQGNGINLAGRAPHPAQV